MPFSSLPFSPTIFAIKALFVTFSESGFNFLKPLQCLIFLLLLDEKMLQENDIMM